MCAVGLRCEDGMEVHIQRVGRGALQIIMEKRTRGEEQRWEGLPENFFISYGTCCIFSGITQDIMKALALGLSARELCIILTLKNGRCFDG
jgi:hypothetical protein